MEESSGRLSGDWLRELAGSYRGRLEAKRWYLNWVPPWLRLLRALYVSFVLKFVRNGLASHSHQLVDGERIFLRPLTDNGTRLASNSTLGPWTF